ncbi:MAG: response regulator [Lachnospiraceae bacterium]|nr:response regulator [Lachnospiraceae bacterium]
MSKALRTRILLYITIAVFFVCIVFVYYGKLYSETKDNIINTGRVHAVESAAVIEQRMASRIEILQLAAFTLDTMLRDKRSQEEILDYLVNETITVKGSLITDTTGIYGYINDEYLDGSGWEPGEDFEPTERPWYVEARAGSGRIVIVDPYVDMDTGTVMISISKTLCDARSVVAIDLSLDYLQSVVEEHARDGLSVTEFILNQKGVIVAHTDSDLIGTEIGSGSDPLLRSVDEGLHRGGSSAYYFKQNPNVRMVYIMPLDNGWSCVSIIDAGRDFTKLRRMIVITVLLAVIIVAVFGLSFYRSEKKNIEIREAAVRAERAQASNEAKSAFLSNMSHEIRTPINAILGMNEVILRESDDSSILAYSENIRSAGTTLLGLVNDVLDFSKIEAGKIEIISSDYDLAIVIGDLVNMIRARAEEKGLLLKTDIDPNTPAHLCGDEVRIRQIILNILTNAVKYTQKGNISFRVGFEKIAGEPDSVMLIVSVRDTGIGIRKEDLDRIFSKFERIEESRNRNIEGTGLGMNITRNLLELMGSALRVESVYGEGSTFSFRLKQKVTDWEGIGDRRGNARQAKGKRQAYKEAFTAPDARILIVDDNPMNLMVFEGLTRQMKMNTDTADSGDKALSLAAKKPYDLIFLDHMMPGKDGIEILSELRAAKDGPNEKTTVICLTANAVSGAREQYLSAGFDDYLTKPIAPEKLEKMLMNYLPAEKIRKTEESTEKTGEGRGDEMEIPAELAFLDGEMINLKSGLRISRTADAYVSLLKVFYETLDDRMKEIRQYFDSGDYKDYVIKIHALKSSARIIGALSLGDMAQEFENAGKKGDITFIRSRRDEFRREVMKLKELLSGLFREDEPAADRPEAGPDILSKFFDELDSAAEDMDSDLIEKMLTDMEAYRIPSGEEELFRSLHLASEQFDYEGIRELLNEKLGRKGEQT